MRSQQILLDRGLFDPRKLDQAYHPSNPAEYRLQTGIVWGILHFAT
jgi:hypothetical protein